MEKAMAPHSRTLAWKIPWMEEPGRLQSMGSLRVGHNWATSLSRFTFMHWRRKWQPIPVFLPGESQGWGSLVAAISGVTQSWTRLKWLSSSSSRGVVRRTAVPLEGRECVKIWWQENFWNCRWINKAGGGQRMRQKLHPRKTLNAFWGISNGPWDSRGSWRSFK